MPKINITEKDLTSASSLLDTSNVVYIPILQSSNTVVTPTLCTSSGELTALSSLNTSTDNYKFAKYLLDTYGMYVVVEGVTITEKTVEEVTTHTTSIDWDVLKDRLKYDIRFFTLGSDFAESDLTDGEYEALEKAMVGCASDRGDAIALVDHKKALTSTMTGVGDIRDFFETIQYTTTDSGVTVKTEDSYASYCTPWWSTKVTALGGTSSTVKELPASFAYLLAYANSINNGNPEYYAIANDKRGSIKELYGVLYDYGEAEIEILQARSSSTEVGLDDNGDNIGFAINPIAYIRPYGYVIWGNRTALYNVDSEGETTGVGVTKATSFLNVRNLVCSVKKKLYETAKKYTFEQNSDVLFINFKNDIAPMLDDMKTTNGIFGYYITKVATTKKARLAVKITIVPIEAVEDFDLTVELTDSIETVSE